jgi:thioredoxin 1
VPVQRIHADAFEGERLLRSGTWAVAFLADWCPFCRSFEPTFESLAGTGPFELAVGDVTDEENPLWERFSLEVVPTVVVFRDGLPTFRRDGTLGRGLSENDVRELRADLARPR